MAKVELLKRPLNPYPSDFNLGFYNDPLFDNSAEAVSGETLEAALSNAKTRAMLYVEDTRKYEPHWRRNLEDFIYGVNGYYQNFNGDILACRYPRVHPESADE